MARPVGRRNRPTPKVLGRVSGKLLVNSLPENTQQAKEARAGAAYQVPRNLTARKLAIQRLRKGI